FTVFDGFGRTTPVPVAPTEPTLAALVPLGTTIGTAGATVSPLPMPPTLLPMLEAPGVVPVAPPAGGGAAGVAGGVVMVPAGAAAGLAGIETGVPVGPAEPGLPAGAAVPGAAAPGAGAAPAL